ncbi:MAG TPA: transglycosylase SLT domain-containing protein [Methylomirabilota bacterium]|nr:transglycosylase SLT domain-containing protein [Methylomirabilota bacterium]
MRRMTVAACLVSLGLVGAAPAPISPDARERFAAGLAAHKAGDWVTAAREFADPAWAGSPLEDYARLFQAESVARQGDLVAARALAAQAADPTPESRLTPSALMRAAAVLREAGDAAAAVTVLQRVVTRLADAPDAPRARYALGEALLAAGDQKEAARVFAALWLQAPATFGDAAERQLKALADAGVTPPAPSALERAARAERLLASGLIERARGESEALVAEKPAADARERALRVLMNSSRRLGRDDAALAAATDGLAGAPPERRASWLLELGRLRQRRDREAALATLDRLVREHPKSNDAPDALLLKADILETAARPAEAEKTYVKLAADYPDEDEGASALWRLGWIAWFRGNHGEATARWTRLQVVRGGQSLRDAATYWLGRVWERRGDRDQAARQFAQLLKDSPRTYYGLLAAQRAPVAGRGAAAGEPSGSGKSAPAAGQGPFAFPADPLEGLQGDARFNRASALREVGLREFADEELDELTRRSVGEPRRLYALSAAYVADERYHMALRILRRSFQGSARSGGTSPREFWEMFYPLGWRDALTAAAGRASVDPFLVAAVVREESSFYPQARSRVGARGLMQLMPDTGRAVAQARQIPFPDAEVLDQPVTNLQIGTIFFGGLLREFGDARLAAAAYNAGPTRVREWWGNRKTDDLEVWVEQIPYNETRAFVKRVMLSWQEYQRVYGEKPS